MKRRNSISGQFAARLIEMLESPAYRALSRSGHMVISRNAGAAAMPSIQKPIKSLALPAPTRANGQSNVANEAGASDSKKRNPVRETLSFRY
jgi:hypothetical protein